MCFLSTSSPRRASVAAYMAVRSTSSVIKLGIPAHRTRRRLRMSAVFDTSLAWNCICVRMFLSYITKNEPQLQKRLAQCELPLPFLFQRVLLPIRIREARKSSFYQRTERWWTVTTSTSMAFFTSPNSFWIASRAGRVLITRFWSSFSFLESAAAYPFIRC